MFTLLLDDFLDLVASTFKIGNILMVDGILLVQLETFTKNRYLRLVVAYIFVATRSRDNNVWIPQVAASDVSRKFPGFQ